MKGCRRQSRFYLFYHKPIIVILCSVYFSIVTPSLHAQKPGFRIVAITLDGNVGGIITDDVNGDSRTDLIAFHINKKGIEAKKYVSIFFQSSDGDFPEEASRRFQLADDALAFGVGDLASGNQSGITRSQNDQTKEIVFLTHDGISYYSLKNEVTPPRVCTLLNISTFFDFPSTVDTPIWHHILDLNGDGRDDIIVPQPNNYLVLFQGEHHDWPTAQKINITPKRQIIEPVFERDKFFLNVESTIPQILTKDFNADGRKDLFALDNDKLMLFLQKGFRGSDATSGNTGRFDEDPTYTKSLPILKSRASASLLEGATIKLCDVNCDNRADMIISRTKGKVGIFESIRTSHILYLNKGDEFFNSTPTQIIKTKGISMRPRFFDFDGDGDQDMLVSSFRTDLISTVKAAILSSVKISYYLYLFEDNDRYSRKPFFQRDVSISTKLLEGNGTIPIAYFEGDFDGDGRRDLLTAAADDKLKVYSSKIGRGLFNKGKIVFEDKPTFEFAVKPSFFLKIRDINGDGVSDIVMYYPTTKGFKNQIHLIVSKKETSRYGKKAH